MKKISLVIPCYNESESLPLLLKRLSDLQMALANRIETEVILVDDHSSDDTSDKIKGACKNYPWLKFIRLSRNSGGHIAIIAGISAASGDCAVFLAADLQDPPELIHSMLDEWGSGVDVVWAVREQRLGVSKMSVFFSNTFFRLLNWSTDINYPKTGADYALLDRKAMDGLVRSAGSKPSLGALIAWMGFKSKEIMYVKEDRKFGKSKWTLSKKLNAFADAFVGFSYLPMRVMTLLGFLAAFLGFTYAAIIFFMRFIIGNPIPGYASLMIVVLIIGGLQMLMLGVLGEYLWRNLEESRKRPLYLIEEQTGFEK